MPIIRVSKSGLYRRQQAGWASRSFPLARYAKSLSPAFNSVKFRQPQHHANAEVSHLRRARYQPHRSRSIFYTDVSYSRPGHHNKILLNPYFRGARFFDAPPNLYKVLLAFSQPLVAYMVVGIPTCSSPLLKNPKVSFGCCRDALVTKVTGLKVYGWIQSGPWSYVSGLPADKISEIDQPAGLVWLFLSIEKESAVCASHLLLGSAGRHGILSYRHGPTDLFSIGASSSATRFYLTKPRARPRREFALPNSLFDNKAESPDPTFISFE
ncbi:hypothetical protein ACFE04_008368 [Oxalis oulophora]